MSIDKQRYVFISNMASPYQVKFCYALQAYFDTEFWFYVQREEDRPKWWEMPLGDNCKILKASGKLPGLGYFSFGLIIDLIKFKPDIVVLGGFMIWHILILWLARLIGAKVAIISEPARYVKSDDDAQTTLLTKQDAKITLNITRYLFRNVDLVIGMGDVAMHQFIDEFDFSEDKVTSLPYPQDIERYYDHPLRDKHYGDPMTLLFANRLIDRYQPLLALEILKKLNQKYPNIKMLMNAEGTLKNECLNYIDENKLINVEFLDKIDSWNNMHEIYQRSDILVLPCAYSNGNGTVIEARASGMGIVMSDQINNSLRHSIHDKNCYICELTVDAFVAGISKYLDDPQLIKKHGALSRTLVEYKRNDNIAKQYYEVFKTHGFVR